MQHTDVELTTESFTLKFGVDVPTAPVPLKALLPVVQSLADAVIDRVERDSAAQGAPVSCRAGCGACCRQVVPIGEAEAQAIRELVIALPEPRRSVIVERFAQACAQLDAAGLLPALRDGAHWDEDSAYALAKAYFALRIACPFLENESCSIHPQRPITCREFLVTSPAENCAAPKPDTIRRLPLPLRLTTAVARHDPRSPIPFLLTIPLILALHWRPDGEVETRTGPEWMREILSRLKTQRTGALSSPQAPD